MAGGSNLAREIRYGEGGSFKASREGWGGGLYLGAQQYIISEINLPLARGLGSALVPRTRSGRARREGFLERCDVGEVLCVFWVGIRRLI